MDKTDLINQYNYLKLQIGHQPTSVEFYKTFKNSRNKINKAFGEEGWNKLVIACGDEPKTFLKDKSDFETILINYGNLFRELNKQPSIPAWEFRYTPTASGIERSHSVKWGQMPQKFLEFACGKPEWQDVINLIPDKSLNIKIEPNISIEKLTDQIKNFIPPIVQNLIDLSYNDSKSLEFEKKINTCFEMLGFEVKRLGQGTGRNPDGIALHKSNPRFAVLIDSKSRSEGYKFGTDDRAFVEYIKTNSESLKNDGFDKIYFLVVSSKFISIPDNSIKRLALETHVPITFLTSELLLNVLAKKIEKPRIFSLDKFRGLLFENGEITQRKIEIF